MKNHKNNRITSFVEKNLGKGIIWGYMGYIFKKKLINLNDILKFYSSVEEKCFFVDDHWFTGYCYYKKIPIYNIPIVNGKLINHFRWSGTHLRDRYSDDQRNIKKSL